MPKPTFFNLPAEKRETIVELALDEFAAHDFDTASISRIVRRAGIAKGSFYQYFADKADLHHYLLSLAFEKKGALLGSPPNPEMGMFDFMRWLLEKGIAFELENPRLSQIGLRAVQNDQLPAALRAAGEGMSGEFFAKLLAQGKASGEVRADVNEETAAFLFTAVFNQLGTHLVQTLALTPEDEQPLFDRPEVRKLFDELLLLLQRGLG